MLFAATTVFALAAVSHNEIAAAYHFARLHGDGGYWLDLFHQVQVESEETPKRTALRWFSRGFRGEETLLQAVLDRCVQRVRGSRKYQSRRSGLDDVRRVFIGIAKIKVGAADRFWIDLRWDDDRYQLGLSIDDSRTFALISELLEEIPTHEVRLSGFPALRFSVLPTDRALERFTCKAPLGAVRSSEQGDSLQPHAILAVRMRER